MPRKPQGLRPIGESVRKIVERIKKEREERQGKDKPIRTQPKLPNMKSGGLSELEKFKASVKGINDTYDDVNTPMKRDRLESKLGIKPKITKSRKPKKDDKKKSKGFERKFPGRPSSPGNPVEVYEVKKGALIGGQKKLDANKDGKISGEDFKILRGKKNKMRGGGIAIKGTNFKGVY